MARTDVQDALQHAGSAAGDAARDLATTTASAVREHAAAAGESLRDHAVAAGESLREHAEAAGSTALDVATKRAKRVRKQSRRALRKTGKSVRAQADRAAHEGRTRGKAINVAARGKKKKPRGRIFGVLGALALAGAAAAAVMTRRHAAEPTREPLADANADHRTTTK